jgi:hypothetical protein
MPHGATGISPSLPGWTLALPEREAPATLTLGARTTDVHIQLARPVRDEGSRWRMEHYLSCRVDGLSLRVDNASFARAFQEYFAVTRDRAPAGDESLSDFAERLARDEIAVLRRGSDAAALCADIKSWPPDVGPALLFRNLISTL